MDKYLRFSLVAVAALTFSIAWGECGGLYEGFSLLRGLLWCAAAWGMARVLLRFAPSTLFYGGLGLLGILPLLCDPVLRGVGGSGAGVEFLLLAGLLNVGFILALSEDGSFTRAVLPISLAATVFAFSLTRSSVSILVGAAAILLAVFVLLRANWRYGTAQRMQPPLRPMAAISGAITVSFCGCVLLGLNSPHSALGAWFPGSGGSEFSDPFGRGGVGNGEGEVAATKKTEDVGFADTDVVVESEKRTLFDAVMEMYGEPEPPKKAPVNRKATFLAREILEKPQGPMMAPRATRGFSTRRSQARAARKTRNEAAKALLYLSGRTPLHLRVTAYDCYKEAVWQEGKFHPVGQAMEPLEKDWMQVQALLLPPITGAAEKHEVKIGLLQSDRIPTPSILTHTRIDRLNIADMYRWAQAGILRLDVPEIPGGTRIELRSLTPDHRKLNCRPLGRLAARRHQKTFLSLPPAGEVDPRIFRLAEEWVSGVPYGWEQVQTVVSRLRSYAAYDRNARPPQGTADPVGWFALKSRRGPDYLFATTATLMLRHLGYCTRLVNGFYISGKKRDEKTRHALADAEDLHFWIEVETGQHSNEEAQWIVFEPTPGYTVLSPIPTLSDRALLAMEGCQQFVSRNVLWLLGAGAVLGILFRFRRACWDFWATLRWKVLAYGSPERAIVDAIALIEARMRWAGCPRAAGATLRRHYSCLARRRAGTEGQALESLLESADRLLYAPPGGAMVSGVERSMAMLAVRYWTRARLAQASQPGEKEVER